MTTAAGVIRFEPHGPADTGLVEWETMDPATLESGEPVQRGHIYHEDDSVGYLVGVWDCTAHTAHPSPYDVDEFMLVLEGAVVMALPDGSDVTIEAGQSFVIPKGLDCQWKVPTYVRKFFMILDDAASPDARNAALARISLPPTSVASSLDGFTDGQAPVEADVTHFLNSDGRMRVRVRDVAAGHAPALPTTAHTLAHVVSGKVTLHTPDPATFGAGETFYLTSGAAVGWTFDAPTRLLEACYAPR